MGNLTAPSPADPITSTWISGVTNDVNDLVDYYSRYTGTTDSLSSGAWSDLTWPTLSEGTGAGLTLTASKTFTLAAGLWEVEFTGIGGTAASHTGTLFALFADTTHTSGTIYAEGQASLLVSQAACTLTAKIKSTGTATLVVSAWSQGNATAMTTTAGTPRLTFTRMDTT